ncbi:MAG: hypothetical protein IT422_06245 [Pirellulaceae bacterium]|nr:hypothetical protein [Pirellulaceae bacterium]
MAKAAKTDANIGDRDSDILEHIARYRLTTRDVLHRLFFSDSEPNAVTKVTSRLVKHRFLNRFDLPLGRSYFVFGPNAMRIFNVAGNKSKAMGPQSLAENLGMLYFCCAQEELHERLLVREMFENFGRITGKKLKLASFYIDQTTGTPTLSQMRVDLGGPAAHVIRKCRAYLETAASNQIFSELITHQRFMITLITSTKSKAQDLEDTLLRHTWPVRFRVEVVPELGTLLINRDSTRLMPKSQEEASLPVDSLPSTENGEEE